jgi:hypothetical protein
MAASNPETPAERITRNVEVHEDRVAERQLGLFAALLKEQDLRIAETHQMQTHAAVTLLEERIGGMVRQYTDATKQAMTDATATITDAFTAKFEAYHKDVCDMVEKYAKDTAQQIKDSKTDVIKSVEDMEPRISTMLTTTEVSVLARLLLLIDGRLKAIEMQLAGYASPEQEREAAVARRRLANEKDAEYAQMTKLAGSATTAAEAPDTDQRNKAEYEYLAARATELARQAQQEAAELRS